MNYKFFYVANWKMYFSYSQEIKWIEDNFLELDKLNNDETEIVVCPSFLSINKIGELLKKGKTFLGAQNCSKFSFGAYTGQISSASLAQLNCKYCIIGHSECRQYFCETNEDIAEKTIVLVDQNITPIICIGENIQDYKQGRTESILEQQLGPILNIINLKNKNPEIIIAYEPIWSIGTGNLPSIQYVDKICNYISDFIKKSKKELNYRIFYGGSVSGKTASELKKSGCIKGFLIGKASTDFQELKKIVL